MEVETDAWISGWLPVSSLPWMENQRMKQSSKTRRLAPLSEIFCTSWRVAHKESKELYSSWMLQDWANQRLFGPSARRLCPRWPETRQGQKRCSGWLRAASMHSQGVNTGCHAVSLNILSWKPESPSWVVFSFRSFRGCRTSVCLICEWRVPYPWKNEFFFAGVEFFFGGSVALSAQIFGCQHQHHNRQLQRSIGPWA